MGRLKSNLENYTIKSEKKVQKNVEKFEIRTHGHPSHPLKMTDLLL